MSLHSGDIGTLREASQFPDPSLFLPQCLHEGWGQWWSGRREEGKWCLEKHAGSQTGLKSQVPHWLFALGLDLHLLICLLPGSS